MRHIPEEELHAYLDQALSRSQCVEIECHLATCVRCRHDRDAIAALRDRTTALLGDLVPRLGRRPSFAALMVQANSRRAEAANHGAARGRAASWYSRGAQAAGVALAIAVGWSARGLFLGGASAPTGAFQQFASGPGLEGFGSRQPLFGSLLPSTQVPAGVQAQPATVQPDPNWQPDPIERSAPRREAEVASASLTPLALTVSTLDANDFASEFPAPGVWRSVSWAEAAALTGDAVPRIHGLPVTEVQLQRIGPDERPLVMVAHQDPSGRIIRLIEGPAERLGDLLSDVIARTDGEVHNSQPVRTTSDYVSVPGGAPRRSIRVATVTGRLEADSLNQLAKGIIFR